MDPQQVAKGRICPPVPLSGTTHTNYCISLDSAQERIRCCATALASVNITPVQRQPGVGSGCIGGKYACDKSHDRYRALIHVSTKPVWSPVIEIVDLRYRPEVNTIETLAESDPCEHAPLAEPIWTITPEGYGLGVDGKSKLNPRASWMGRRWFF